jgi:hypothetical protein
MFPAQSIECLCRRRHIRAFLRSIRSRSRSRRWNPKLRKTASNPRSSFSQKSTSRQQKLFLSDAKIETLHDWRQAINYYRLTLNQKLFLSDTKSEILQDWRHTINHSSMTPNQNSFMRDAKSEIVLEQCQIRNPIHTINLSEVTSQITLKITIE